VADHAAVSPKVVSTLVGHKTPGYQASMLARSYFYDMESVRPDGSDLHPLWKNSVGYLPAASSDGRQPIGTGSSCA
jgi:hypothetical protein